MVIVSLNKRSNDYKAHIGSMYPDSIYLIGSFIESEISWVFKGVRLRRRQLLQIFFIVIALLFTTLWPVISCASRE